jgi:short-chain Z-isoprenyl diphosphate synthase
MSRQLSESGGMRAQSRDIQPKAAGVAERALSLVTPAAPAHRVEERTDSGRLPPQKPTLRDYVRKVLYRLYESRLQRQIADKPFPRHIGIILDGNRRESVRRGVSEPGQIYAAGADRLDAVLEWCCELQIPAVTLWVCSTDNLARPAHQIAGILAAIEAKMLKLVDDPQVHLRRVRVTAIGRLEVLPQSTLDAIRAAEAATAHYDGLRLTIAVAYGGREEITDAVRSLLKEQETCGLALADAIEEITPEAIGRHLYLAGLPDPELIIRTSGETRLSGFLLWQSTYSEFYFSDVNWPAFRKLDFLRAIRAFQGRRRRYGL